MSTTYLPGRQVNTVTPDLIDPLKRAAAAAPLRRARLCLHRTAADAVHEMVIALCRDSHVPPHRHKNKSESFHLLEGEMLVFLFDPQGHIVARHHLAAPGSSQQSLPFLFRLDAPVYHCVLPLTDFVVFHETTAGPFDPAQKDIAPFAPDESDPNALPAFQKFLTTE